MSILIAILMVLGGLLLLWKGADLLVGAASAIAKKIGVSPIVVGLTIVAFGTSLPELLVSVLSAIQGNSAIAFGNVLGSNIANVLLILGLSAAIKILPMKKNTVKIEIPIAIVAALAMLIMAPDGLMSRFDGVILLILFFAFFAYTLWSARKQDNSAAPVSDLPEKNVDKPMKLSKSILFIIIGLIGLAIGGQLTVNGASAIASFFGLSQALIGLTIVAIGTSLPELVTCIVGVARGETDIVIGNIVGSNIFNTFWILGLSAVIKPVSINGDFRIDLLINFLTFVAVLVFSFITKPKYALKKWQGFLLVLAYVIYMIFIINRDLHFLW